MPALDERVDYVVGVDTHRDSHTAAVVDLSGGVLSALTVPSDAFGAKRILKFARENGPGRRVWAIEGTGSLGAGLTTFLLEQIEARTQAIALLKATIVSAPEGLRLHFRKMTTDEQLVRAARLRTNATQSIEHRATICALRSIARRALALEAEAADLESQLELLVVNMAPTLLAEPGIGVISEAQILNAWSHPGRLRSEAAFAALAGVAPIPASSGHIVRYRLNRGGDRQLNRALHTAVLSRLAHHQETRAYAERRLAEGKTPREIKRCLKRHLARRIFRLLEASVTT